ncbi:bacillithiol biosynthesis deacetylase BshB1 [Shouchella patagoniensis]|uniref:bacillithiol biosynthesis deacetylase BshB1 n=1 Tax=Shouchella patagoniensis TaxID=228576 RepID=UPI0009954838|nr:bacillithiol biosynthesis deacetylase BshB1 [Shouchella patagoniensis]
MDQTVDILACGAHPDDIEIGMGATIASYIEKGYTCGFLTLTKAELSSNGTVEIRQKEASRAADILGVKQRYQLNIPDRGLTVIQPNQLKEIVSIIRLTKPRLVFMPEKDRHPDHGACGLIMQEAIFNAGIRHYKSEGTVHKVSNSYRYFINGYSKPDFVIDVGSVYEKKQQALQAYASQFAPVEGVRTPLTDDYIESVQARDRIFGKQVGVRLAEGFKTEKPLLMSNLLEGCGT